jgi:hypothetical protein
MDARDKRGHDAKGTVCNRDRRDKPGDDNSFPHVNPPPSIAAFRQAILAAGSKWIMGPSAVLRHHDNDIAAVFGGEIANIARQRLAGKYASELVVDRLAAFGPQRRKWDRQFTPGEA